MFGIKSTQIDVNIPSFLVTQHKIDPDDYDLDIIYDLNITS